MRLTTALMLVAVDIGKYVGAKVVLFFGFCKRVLTIDTPCKD